MRGMHGGWQVLGWTALAMLLAIVHIAWGPVDVPAGELWNALIDGEGRNGVLVREVRLPRVLTAAGAGAALALCGLALQTWFHNPLAGPSVLGITSGASLGVALAVLAGWTWHTGWGFGSTTAGAVLGAGAVLLLVLAVSARQHAPVTLLVFGLMLGHVVGAVTTVLQAEARSEALGDPGNPLDRAQIVGKLQEAAAGWFDPATTARVAALVDRLEDLGDVRELMAIFRAGRDSDSGTASRPR